LAITREKKGELVSEYTDKLRRSQAVIVTEYRGLTVKQLQDLRRELRANNSELVVAKNTLLGRALAEAGLPDAEKLLKGPTAVALCYEELAAPAKALNKFARDSKVLVIKGGLLGQSVFGEAGVQELADLPSREQLLGQVVGTLQAPISGLVNVLAGTLRGLVNVLNARADKLEQPAA
jgi:large subunit ribosomal protein L10